MEFKMRLGGKGVAQTFKRVEEADRMLFDLAGNHKVMVSQQIVIRY